MIPQATAKSVSAQASTSTILKTAAAVISTIPTISSEVYSFGLGFVIAPFGHVEYGVLVFFHATQRSGKQVTHVCHQNFFRQIPAF